MAITAPSPTPAWPQAKSDGAFLVTVNLNDDSFTSGPNTRNTLTACLLHEVGDLLDVVHVVGQLGRHELRG